MLISLSVTLVPSLVPRPVADPAASMLAHGVEAIFGPEHQITRVQTYHPTL